MELLLRESVVCSANISLSLSGERLHLSKHLKMSLTNQHKYKYPLELKFSDIHNHSINSADAMRYHPVPDNVKVNLSTYSKVTIRHLVHSLSTKETCWPIRITSKL